jgi:ABC-type polysaccharide/polyol phosphate transport system ATPase subunit
MAILEVNNLSKTFIIPAVRRDTVREYILNIIRSRATEKLKVLDDISFNVERGESLGIMGANGSGKSTLFKILSGIYQPDTGSVKANGQITAILELGVGWNFELDAIDNILITATLMGTTLREAKRSVNNILVFTELERFAKLKLKYYSAGMMARLAYGVAFSSVREIVMIDEVFSVGDAAFRKRCEQHFEELHSAGHTVILISHNPEVISKFCNRALLIEGGKIFADDRADEVAKLYQFRLLNR